MASRPASAPDGAAQPRSGSSATGVRPVTRTRSTGEVMRRVRTGSVGHEEDDCPARASSRRCHSIPCNRVGPDVNLRGTRRLSLTASCCRPRSLTQRGLDVASVSVTVPLKVPRAHRLDVREITKDVAIGPFEKISRIKIGDLSVRTLLALQRSQSMEAWASATGVDRGCGPKPLTQARVWRHHSETPENCSAGKSCIGTFTQPRST